MTRSWFAAPADDAEKLVEGLKSGADALIIDLSQSDSANAPQARENAVRLLRQARPTTAPALYVMVHDGKSAILREDIAAVIPLAPAGVILPSAEAGADVQKLDVMISAQEALAGLPPGKIRIVAMAADTAAGLFSAGSYGAKSSRLQALAWSADRLAADLGAHAAQDTNGRWIAPLEMARSLVLLGAAAARVEAIDASSPDSDIAAFEAECRAAKAYGYSGKFVLNAEQVAIASLIFRR
ncbi:MULTISPECIES: aldolase/citrate lyase family protein [unclassified Sinorhizobium]|uniref:aldolase/citrate lyase family protein n=1 Tax=unclassified Sinorhizobium TaxID=2613772 RepID=UPI003523E7E9